ncbi:MAG: ABC transporter permease, partial [Gemmatimonadota bacterium]|nr:ABC transporter permease [Gemmatimonadota bacterium]
ADGATLQSAQAELATVGARTAAAHPGTHERLRPWVRSYTRAFFDIDNPENPGSVAKAQLFRLFISLLLVVVAVNVASLVYARTATRAGEIAVRTALGASRARIVTQLFAEALVLCGTASVIGLAVAGTVLAKLQETAERRLGELPFWVDLGLSPAVITYALVLAIVGAAIVGVVPALTATGRRVRANLQQLSGHGAHMQLGRAWTALIIAQVSVAVAVLPFAVHFTEEVLAESTRDAGYPAGEFLEASLVMERADGALTCGRIGFCDQSSDTGVVERLGLDQRFHAGAAELIRRIESDPAVAGVTVRIRDNERIEVERVTSSDADKRPISLVRGRVERVAAGFFALYGMPMLAGRALVPGDAHGGATAVVVNQVFAEIHFGTEVALGRRLRFVRERDGAGDVDRGPWLEIIGIVRDLESSAYEPVGRMYLPTDVTQLSPPVALAVRTRASPAAGFAPRLRELAADVDPALQLQGLVIAAERHRQSMQLLRWQGVVAAAAMVSVLLLSAAGIYAMMSFTVTRRRREIGIRSALGADPTRVLRSIFARAGAQIGAGLLVGVVGTVAVDRATGSGPVHDGNPAALLVVAAVMTAIGLLAAIGPARRGLAIQPTEALREE